MGDSSPIKVMHIIARMNVGGPAVEIVELMRGLDPQVVSQRLVTGYCEEDEADYLETQAQDIPATRIRGLGRSVRLTDDLRAFHQLVKLIRNSRPDIVHTHTAKAGVLGRIAARVAGTKPQLVHTYHGHLLHGYFGATSTKLIILVDKVLATWTSQIICVGSRVRDDLIRARIGVANRFTVIRVGVEDVSLPDERLARTLLGLGEQDFVVLMLGRLTAIKRPDRLLEVVRRTSHANRNLKFVVAGGGPDEAELRRVAKEEDLPIVVLGWRSDVEQLVAAADVMLLTSDNEGTPIALIQGALGAVPAVATNVGSVSEVVEHGVTGFLCPPRPGKISQALLTLVGDPDLLELMGREARRRALREFSLQTCVDHHRAMYEGVVDFAFL